MRGGDIQHLEGRLLANFNELIFTKDSGMGLTSNLPKVKYVLCTVDLDNRLSSPFSDSPFIGIRFCRYWEPHTSLYDTLPPANYQLYELGGQVCKTTKSRPKGLFRVGENCVKNMQTTLYYRFFGEKENVLNVNLQVS